mmetsp:Transcript_1360/g.1944  ORF Transcript_1360/g.1944 Transcript_1360/m.1944 type:complete len:117 (-) Transcript_1360:216-566(-)
MVKEIRIDEGQLKMVVARMRKNGQVDIQPKLHQGKCPRRLGRRFHQGPNLSSNHGRVRTGPTKNQGHHRSIGGLQDNRRKKADPKKQKAIKWQRSRKEHEQTSSMHPERPMKELSA